VNSTNQHKSLWLDKILQNSHIGILVVDKKHNVLLANKTLCEIFGYTESELINHSVDILYPNAKSHADFISLALKSISNKKSISLDYEFRKKDGSLFWAKISGDIIENENEVLWSIIDITHEVSLQLKNKQQAQIIEQIHDSVIATDLDGFITSWNYGSELLLEYSSSEMIGKHITSIYREEDYKSLEQIIETLKKRGSAKAEVYLVKKSSEILNVELSLSLLKNEDNEIIGLVGYSKDITRRKKIEKKLQDSNDNFKKYLEVIDKIEIGLFVVDENYIVRYMNSTMKKWFGDQTDKVCFSSVAGLEGPCPYCKLREVVEEDKKVEYNPTTSDGRSFEVVATSILNADGTKSKMEVIRDVTAQKEANDHLLRQKEELAYQAHHDSLTHLPNRLFFNSRLEQSIAKAKRSNTKMALLFIDLDHFKEINDSLGHEAGDKVLEAVTQRLRKAAREADMVARLGGDEFTILMENLHHGQDASVLARKILDLLVEPILVDENVLYVTSSIGVSLYPDDGTTVQNLLKYADAAMYKAKSEGRNNFQFYSAEMTELAFERVMMETSLRKAIINEDFIVYYQPQVDAENEKIIGFEALVRWDHISMGIIPPSKFIPLAESTGLIVELDRFVMKTAVKQLQEWYDKGLNPGKISLNLTVKQMHEADFIDFLEELIETTHCNANLIELEIVEGQIMNNPKEAIALLERLTSLGIKLAIDDFGTGYSSLSYLKKFPLDRLKIDQSFVRELPGGEEDAAISRAVIALSNSLNLRIIAEGVETHEQKDFLIANGCLNIQGFLYSKPVPADTVTKILQNTKQFFADTH
jgi:diguanylate cyclase (GGDEF)-like protein/PAS domain S-box-containing protein